MSGEVVDLAVCDPRPFVVATTILTETVPHGSVKLRRGEELFVVAQDQPIIQPGYRGPDEVYCDGSEVGAGKWPVMLCRVRTMHSDEWKGLSAAVANRMLERARRRLADASTKSREGK